MRSERPAPKSMGHEVTFARDTADPEFLQATLLDLADRVASGLRREGYAGRTLVLKLRDSRFRTMSRQRTLPAATNVTQVIYEAALGLLAELHEPGRLLRLVGLTVSGLTEAGQTALDDSGVTRSATRRWTGCGPASALRRSAGPGEESGDQDHPAAGPGPGAAGGDARGRVGSRPHALSRQSATLRAASG